MPGNLHETFNVTFVGEALMSLKNHFMNIFFQLFTFIFITFFF